MEKESEIILKRKSGESVILRKHLSQQNYMKIANSVWLILYVRDNGKEQHSSRPLARHWLEWYSIFNI
jgi:hypothetical protein